MKIADLVAGLLALAQILDNELAAFAAAYEKERMPNLPAEISAQRSEMRRLWEELERLEVERAKPARAVRLIAVKLWPVGACWLAGGEGYRD